MSRLELSYNIKSNTHNSMYDNILLYKVGKRERISSDPTSVVTFIAVNDLCRGELIVYKKF